MAAPTATRPARTGATAPRRTLLAASTAAGLVLVNFTLPMPILPTITSGLGASIAEQTWILAGINPAIAATLLTTGSLADQYGRRRVFRAGLAVLAASSLLSALAPTALIFIAARMVQGVGSAAVLTSSLGLLAHAYPDGESRTHATGVWAAMMGAGIAVGPLVGALAADWQWRSGYWLIAAAAAALIPAAPREPAGARSGARQPVDWIGVLTLAGGVAALLAALVLGNRDGWATPEVIGAAVGGAVLLAGFILTEARVNQPMITLSLFRAPPFVGSLVASAATGASVVALMSYAPTFLQRGLGRSAVGSAVVLLLWSATACAVSMYARRLARAMSTRVQLAAGLCLCAVGLGLMHGFGADSRWTWLLTGLVVAGFGSGSLNAALARAAVDTVPPAQAGTGAGANNTVRYLGSGIGVAVVIAASQARARQYTADVLPSVPATIGDRIGHDQLAALLADGKLAAVNAVTPASAHPALADLAARAQASGFGVAALVAVGICLLGALAAATLLPSRGTASTAPKPRRGGRRGSVSP